LSAREIAVAQESDVLPTPPFPVKNKNLVGFIKKSISI
jgi:hypothetical protein